MRTGRRKHMDEPAIQNNEQAYEAYAAVQPEIKRYLDMRRRVVSWPLKKKEAREIILGYLASLFELERSYTEKEVNELLSRYIVFNDCATVRRTLYDYSYLKRERDGSRYWRVLR
jgi:hypothetical protein